MSFTEEFDIALRARCSVIYIVTHEEDRVMQDVELVRIRQKKQLLVWDLAGGFSDGSAKGNPVTALTKIAEDKDDGRIYVLKDYHRFIDDNLVNRTLRNLASALLETRKNIVICAPVLRIPPELYEDVYVLDYEYPDFSCITEFVRMIIDPKTVSVRLNATQMEILLKAFQGLTTAKIRTILAKAAVKYGAIDERAIGLVLDEKEQFIKRTQVLQFYPSLQDISGIGGLDVLKSWIECRGKAFSELAKNYMLPLPKGLLLVGIQGTGKSLSAKAIAKNWNMPLLKLDVGRLMGSLVGESESRTREMIRTAEAMSPCVLWVDEIDKAFAGVTGPQGDSGVASRMFGSFITWMQEKTKPVFIVATANNIDALPPELLRKGRFDEIFFVNLPTRQERFEIFELHLEKRRPGCARNFDVHTLAAETKGFSGAEIEQVIVDAMYNAFDAQREFCTEDILHSIENTVPLAKACEEQIGKLKSFAAAGKARYASSVVSDDESNGGGSFGKLGF